MVSYVRLPAREVEGGVGSVYADIVVSNHEDEVLARNGHLPASAIRNVSLREVLVDTGATTLCLPASVIRNLGLPLKRLVVVETANGAIEAAVHAEATLEVLGRSATVECLALPDGSRPLLGVIPLEMLGLQPNLVSHQLEVLPDSGPGTYLYV